MISDRFSKLIMEHYGIGHLSLSMLTLLRHGAGQRVPASASKHALVGSAALNSEGTLHTLACRCKEITLIYIAPLEPLAILYNPLGVIKLTHF